ncbi:hypothetical protein [Fodinicurvata sp. EGI_FJ10296]|uniref:hypothetical protein n=1 Tax=Fodinicurvata sp. EGI_FJ10296 TaxID=3231908 RepID=UPI0034570579
MLVITDDITRQINRLRRHQRRHVPFAMARAMTLLAREGRDAVRESLPQRFNIRRPWVIQGVRFVFATKQSLTSTVYSRDRFMVEQETGGTKTENVRPIPAGRLATLHRRRPIPRSLSAERMKDRSDVFERDGMLWQTKPGGLEPLYVLAGRLRMKKRFGMREQITELAGRRSEAVFARVLREATADDR